MMRKNNSLQLGIREISEKIERIKEIKKCRKNRSKILFFDTMIKEHTKILTYLKSQAKNISYNEAMLKYYEN